MDLMELNGDQMEKLRLFQEIANLDEMDMAVVTLTSCDWNLENAIEAHLGGTPQVRGPRVGISREDYVPDFDDEPMMVEEARQEVPVPSRFAARAAPAASASSSSSGTNSQKNAASTRGAAGRTPPVAVASSSSDSAAGVVAPTAARTAPASSAARTMEYSDESDTDDDYDYAMDEEPEEPVRAVASSNGANHGPNSNGVPLIPTDCNSAIEGTQNFQSVFEARYVKDGRGHLMPPFFIGSLQSATREAFDCPDRPVSERAPAAVTDAPSEEPEERQGGTIRRPLALYIHHDGSIAKNIFPQTVLCSDQVLALLRSQFVVWPWDVTAKENEEKLTQWLSESSLYDVRPIVASFLNNADRFPLLILLSKDGGQIRMVDFVNGSESSDQAMEKLLVCMDAYATSKISLEKQEQERIERDLLRKEQERELQESLAEDREKAERQAREIREAKEAEERLVKEKEEKEKMIAALKASLPAEPAEGTPNVCTVRFRLPEQGMALRRFCMSSPLSVMLTFLESEGFPVTDYRMMNSDFPQKKDISEWEPKSTLADLKMPAREVINVEER